MSVDKLCNTVEDWLFLEHMIMKRVSTVMISFFLFSTLANAQSDDFKETLEIQNAGRASVQTIDFQEALERAKAGDALAQYAVGEMYWRGEGSSRDLKEAVRWFRLSAEQGLAEAQLTLGVRYELGDEVVQNYLEAEKWYRLAATQGLAEAQNNLASMYEEGKGVPHSDETAYVWFAIATANGHNSTIFGRDRMEKLLSPKALEQAQALATKCFESNFKECGE